MQTTVNPDRSEWDGLTSRRTASDDTVARRVAEIIDRVRADKDKALYELTAEIDGINLGSLAVSDDCIAEASEAVSADVKQAITSAAQNIRKFHNAQRFTPIETECTAGVKCSQRSVPVERVGIYIPGGSAPLFSTVLMLAIPAKIAGCRHITMCTPCGKDGRIAPEVLYAASLCGVDTIYRIGGAQAIAAMAYGTESIKAVDKIFGPGNRYVTRAKQMVSVDVAIDMPAGPSEVLVVADEYADPRFVAADMLSQAEHGPDSQTILVCESLSFAESVAAQTAEQLEQLPRKSIAEKALANSRTVVFDNFDDRVDFVNSYAPEHLIIQTREPWAFAERVTAAGSVFIGEYSPESAGDYASGTNHTLPTSGWAKSFSGVNLDSFSRKITYQQLTRSGLESLATTIVLMAEREGLDAHANAVKIRLNKK